MCICLYVSDIHFFYSNFLSFASVPVPHHSGAGLALHKHCPWGGTEQHHPREETVSPKAHFLVCSSPSQDNWTGLVWLCHPTCQPVSAVKYLDRCFWVQSQPPMQVHLYLQMYPDVPCAPERARLDSHAKGCWSPCRHVQRGVLQEPHADESKPGSTPWSR